MDGAQNMFLEGIIISLVCRDEVVFLLFFFFYSRGKKKTSISPPVIKINLAQVFFCVCVWSF